MIDEDVEVKKIKYKVTFCTWREWRKETLNWGSTLYSGFRTFIDGVPVLVSKLSHGMRVIPIHNRAHFLFETIGDQTEIEMSEDLLKALKEAFESDQKLQSYQGEYASILQNLN